MSMDMMLLAVPDEEVRQAQRDAGYAEDLFERRDEYEVLDLDKAWDGLMYLLDEGRRRGDGPEVRPASAAGKALGGSAILNDDFDTGYGPPSYHSTAEAEAVARALTKVSTAGLRAAFDPAAMNGAHVYPGSWDEEGMLENWLLPTFDKVRDFYERVSVRRHSVIVAIY